MADLRTRITEVLYAIRRAWGRRRMELEGADPFTWRRIIRRARLGSTVKLVAAMLADYASPDGRDVRPGNKLLVAVTELSDKSVRMALAKLRDLGLIERTRVGSRMGRRELADEYRLTIPVDLFERVPMLNPDEGPVAGTGDNGLSPVDNPRTPVADTADSDRSPVTRTGDPAEPEPGSPVTEVRSPVTGSRITGTTYRTPNQVPNHKTPTNKPSGQADHQAELEVPTTIIVTPNERNDLEADDPARNYPAAAAILGRLPDLGAKYIAQAETELQTKTPMRPLIIRAAQICLTEIPATHSAHPSHARSSS